MPWVRDSASCPTILLTSATKTAYFCGKYMSKHRDSIDSVVARRIGRMKPGRIFAPRDLAAIGSRTAVASALSRQLKAGTLRQPARGLYQVPATHPVLGELRPSPDALANALAEKHTLRLQPAGAYAANLLGLSDQVSMKVVYLTDGTPRQVRAGTHQIILRRTTPRNMATAGRISGLVIQAFRHFGQRRVDSTMVDRLRKRLSNKDRAQLLKDAQFAPAWIATLMREIASRAK